MLHLLLNELWFSSVLLKCRVQVKFWCFSFSFNILHRLLYPFPLLSYLCQWCSIHYVIHLHFMIKISCARRTCAFVLKNGIDDYTLLTVWYSDQTSKVRIKPKTWMTLLSSWQKWVPDPYPNHWGGTSSSYSAQTNSGTGALKYNLKKNTNIYS